jgi:putative transposase
LLLQFSKQRSAARRRYIQYVVDGISKPSIWDSLRQQIYLGDDTFIDRIQCKAKVDDDELSIPQAQRRKPAPTLKSISAEHPERDDAIEVAYATGAYSYSEIAKYFGIHQATVGRIIRFRMQQSEN